MKYPVFQNFVGLFLLLSAGCAQVPAPPPQPTPTALELPSATPLPTAIPPTLTPLPIKAQRVNPVCVCSHLNWLDEAEIDKQLDLMKEAGVKWTRFDFAWGQMETSENVWDFSLFDRIVDKALARGVQVLALIPQYDVPGWRNGNQTSMYPPSAQDYAMFAGKVAEHFKGRIILYELGNEPDIVGFWPPAPDAVAYTQFLKKGYAAIKAADPDAKVISAGLTSNDQTDFIATMYANGAKGSFDYFGYHPYGWPNDPDIGQGFFQANAIRRIMEQNNDLKPIMATEVGWPSTTQSGGVSEKNQAAFIERVFQKILFEDFQFIPIACIYDFKDDGPNPADPENNFGLLRDDYSKKPSFSVLQSALSSFEEHFIPLAP